MSGSVFPAQRKESTSKYLAFPQESVDFLLREQFDAKRHARFDQTAFDQAVHRHVRNSEFLGCFTHRESVPLQLLTCLVFIHAQKERKTLITFGNVRKLGGIDIGRER